MTQLGICLATTINGDGRMLQCNFLTDLHSEMARRNPRDRSILLDKVQKQRQALLYHNNFQPYNSGSSAGPRCHTLGNTFQSGKALALTPDSNNQEAGQTLANDNST